MTTEKKKDPFAEMVEQQAKAKQDAAKVAGYGAIEAIQLFDRLVLDAMVTREPARKALAEGDYTSTKTRQRVGIALQRLGIDPEALATALDLADAKRHRG